MPLRHAATPLATPLRHSPRHLPRHLSRHAFAFAHCPLHLCPLPYAPSASLNEVFLIHSRIRFVTTNVLAGRWEFSLNFYGRQRCSSTFSLIEHWWLICIMQLVIKMLRLPNRIFYLPKKINVLHFLAIVNCRKRKKYPFPFFASGRRYQFQDGQVTGPGNEFLAHSLNYPGPTHKSNLPLRIGCQGKYE